MMMNPSNETGLEPSGDPRRAQGMPWWPAAAIVAVLLLVLGWFLYNRFQARQLPPAQVAEAAEPEPAEPPPPAAEAPEVWDLPSIGESDDFLRDVASALSSHPEWVAWIATDDLVRRFVAGVDEVARGELPTAQAGFLTPKRGFQPVSAGDDLYLGSASYDRFDTLAAVVSGLDARGVAALYDRLRPLFRDAYRDLGYPRADFDLALNRAIRKILEAPELDRRPELEPALQTYEYADPELEALPPVQKWMLRLGPENSHVVKSKLREIAAALDREQVAGADSEP